MGAAATSILSSLGQASIRDAIYATLSIFVIFLVCWAANTIRTIYFHPLSRYPGPKWAAASWLPFAFLHYRGTISKELLRLHNKYGPVVRIGPEELSYISPTAAKEIYGHQPAARPEFMKENNFDAAFGEIEQNILNAEHHEHAIFRKLLFPGFSDKALRQQEGIITEYTNTLITRLHQNCDNGRKKINILDWFNFVTFDIIGYLTYGESFNCLESSTMHSWITIYFNITRFTSLMQVVSRLPKLLKYPYMVFCIPKGALRDFKTEQEVSTEKTNHRISTPSSVPDFLEKLVDAYKAQKMSHSQLVMNAKVLMGAGSETTATWLTALIYYLFKTPRALKLLRKEIRETFKSDEEINFVTVNSLPYLLACLEEALRIHPPSPALNARIVPAGGGTVEGQYIPAGTRLKFSVYAACQSTENFQEPETFIPERWMGDARYESDKRDALQAFSLGPRNCIGRNLAYVEAKIIMAKLLWHFDVEDAGNENWHEQVTQLVWQKGPLMVKLKPKERSQQ